MTDGAGLGSGGGVTTVIRRRVRPDRRSEYERALASLLGQAVTIEGYLGADIHRPPRGDDDDDTYVSIVRFESTDHLDAFRRSDLHGAFEREVADLVAESAVWDTTTGLELWFDPPPGTTVAQPVRWRMALVLGVVVYLLVLVFGAIASAAIGDWPAPLRLAAVIAVEITVMTYLLMPRITRALAGWIYPTRRTT